ncbi:MAG: hypothetical protein H8M99_00615, partial [Gloeobacteraceae cyanobacterium ES-bin-144]|nr:hypothetical protein [Verrucomicrobiales bacterium]
ISSGVQEYAYSEPPFVASDSESTGPPLRPSVHFRANGKALVAWCDGHVTSESKTSGASGHNLHGGDDEAADLGWFGPSERNGYWNPKYTTPE